LIAVWLTMEKNNQTHMRLLAITRERKTCTAVNSQFYSQGVFH
jgi:hypothetical protein